jgi:hypothetical protein
MSGTSYNFKDNLTIDNNKFLKWIDSTGTTRSNIISLDNTNNVNFNSGKGDININSNSTNGSFTFINVNNPSGAIVGSRLGVGLSTTENTNANITVVTNGYIGTNSVDGYLGLSGSYNLDTTSAGKIILHGTGSTSGSGDVNLSAGGSGGINLMTGDDLRMAVTGQGDVYFTPGGSTIQCSISEAKTTFAHSVTITCSTESTSSTTGAFQVMGGVGVSGDCYISGELNVSGVSGNINYDSSQESVSYTTGAIKLVGGLGISSSRSATSITSGGGISVAGGVAVGKNMYVGGGVVIVDTTSSINSQTGSLVLYGGLGINNGIWSRTDSDPQLRLAPATNGAETSIAFFSTNNFTLNDSNTWRLGQNVESGGEGNVSLYNSQSGHVIMATKTGKVGINNSDPAYTLDVDGTAKITQALVAQGATNTLGNIITANGNVGISTTDPQSALDVNGTINVSSSISIKGTRDAESLTSSTLVVSGGAAIGKSLIVGSSIYSDNINTSRATIANICITDNISIESTTQSSGLGSGGSLTVLGGASISKDVYVGGTVTSASDIRLKKDVKTLGSVLNLIDDIQTIRYRYINQADDVEMIGFVAQDFVEKFPELLRKPEDGFYSLDYSKITVLLMRCVQELKTELEELRCKTYK